MLEIFKTVFCYDDTVKYMARKFNCQAIYFFQLSGKNITRSLFC